MSKYSIFATIAIVILSLMVIDQGGSLDELAEFTNNLLAVSTDYYNTIQSLTSPTYTHDIQPIFKNRCSRCHDAMIGRNWQIYGDAYLYQNTIREKMITKEMPLGDKMPQEERNLIIKWVETGAKK